jgi:Tfp pilus assembly protein PilZ
VVHWIVPDQGDGSLSGMGLAFMGPSKADMLNMQGYFKQFKPDLVQWNKATGTCKWARRQRQTSLALPKLQAQQQAAPAAPAPAPAPAPAAPAPPAPAAPAPAPAAPQPQAAPAPAPAAAAPAPAPAAAAPAPAATVPDGMLADRKLTIAIGATTENALWLGFAEDISEGGLFIATQDHWSSQMLVDVDLKIEGDSKMHPMRCRVKWLRPDLGVGSPSGMGLEFVQIERPALQALRRYISNKNPDVLFWDED